MKSSFRSTQLVNKVFLVTFVAYSPLTKLASLVKVFNMVLDSKWAVLLSDFFLDIAKAFFISTFITGVTGSLLLLTKGIVNVMMFLSISRLLLQFK